MINEFTDSDVLQFCLMMVLKRDNGKVEICRVAGVTREVLGLFCIEFSLAASTGVPEKVLSIKHDFQKPKWQSVGRIIVIGFRKVNSFPLFISNAFIGCCLFGEEAITNDCLLESFELHVSKDEKDTVNK